MRLPDPRSYGSKNPGATNVLRTGNKARRGAHARRRRAARAGGRASLARACSCIRARSSCGRRCVAASPRSSAISIPVFHRFQGGKGVATAAGVLFGFDAWLGLGTLATFGVIVALLPLCVARVDDRGGVRRLLRLVPQAGGVTDAARSPSWRLLLVWRHQENIQRLVAGTESKLGAKKLRRQIPARPDAEGVAPRQALRAHLQRRGRARSSRRCRCKAPARGRRPRSAGAPPAHSSAARSCRLAPTPPATISRVESGGLESARSTSPPALRRSRRRRRAR